MAGLTKRAPELLDDEASPRAGWDPDALEDGEGVQPRYRRLRELLLEGMASEPAGVADAAFFEARRAWVRERGGR